MSELKVFQSIAKEVKIDSDGRATVAMRGAARCVGITQPALTKSFKTGDNLAPSKLAEKLVKAGFEPDNLAKSGIPDIALALIIEYYAFDAGRYCTEQALILYRTFAAVGVRTCLQKSIGWEPAQHQVATTESKALPYPGVTLRVRIIRAVDNYVHLFKANHQQVWAAIYRDLKHTFKYDVKAALKAADAKGRSKLEQIEIDNKLEELRSVAQVVLGTEI